MEERMFSPSPRHDSAGQSLGGQQSTPSARRWVTEGQGGKMGAMSLCQHGRMTRMLYPSMMAAGWQEVLPPCVVVGITRWWG